MDIPGGKDRAVNMQQKPLFNYKLLPRRWDSSPFLARNYCLQSRIGRREGKDAATLISPISIPQRARRCRLRRRRGLGPAMGREPGLDRTCQCRQPVLQSYRPQAALPPQIHAPQSQTPCPSTRSHQQMAPPETAPAEPLHPDRAVTWGVPRATGWNHIHALITKNTVTEEEMGTPWSNSY